jgi:hypothetical protein
MEEVERLWRIKIEEYKMSKEIELREVENRKVD